MKDYNRNNKTLLNYLKPATVLFFSWFFIVQVYATSLVDEKDITDLFAGEFKDMISPILSAMGYMVLLMGAILLISQLMSSQIMVAMRTFIAYSTAGVVLIGINEYYFNPSPSDIDLSDALVADKFATFGGLQSNILIFFEPLITPFMGFVVTVFGFKGVWEGVYGDNREAMKTIGSGVAALGGMAVIGWGLVGGEIAENFDANKAITSNPTIQTTAMQGFSYDHKGENDVEL